MPAKPPTTKRAKTSDASRDSKKPQRRPARSEPGSGLTKDKIVAVALEQIDVLGLDAFSVRDVARVLGVYPTAIYYHVPGRNALLGEVCALVLSDITPPRSTDGNWKEWLRELFCRYRQVMAHHPNLAQLVGAQMMSNSHLNTTMIDRLLGVLDDAGFPGETIVETYNVVIVAMTGFATLEFAPLPQEDPERWSADLAARVHNIRALENPSLARHLPALANRAFVLRWQSGRDAPFDSSFEAYVNVILAGLEQRLLGSNAAPSAKS